MLKAKQKKLIPLIIKLGNVEKACKEANVDRGSYYNWLENEEFNKELKAQQDFVYLSALNELQSLNTEAVKVYRDLLNSADESIKFRTASAIIDYTNKLIESKELKERLETIEKSLEIAGEQNNES